MQAVREYQIALERMNEADNEANRERLQAAMTDMDARDAWDYEARIKQVLSMLQIDRLDQPVAQLSGGQKRRLTLAQALVAEPAMLILDEPTNHLDHIMVEWLEEYLNRPELTLLMVTHDRYFLDRICNRILELEQGTMFSYEGNYNYFLEKRAERHAAQEKQVHRAQNLMRKELEWLRRQPKARGTKSKKRIEAVGELQQQAQQAPREEGFEFQMDMQRQGKKILELHHVSKSLGGNPLVKDFTYTFKKQDRVGVLGRNGVGKTTLLQLITGELAPDAGEVIAGPTTQFGYFKQQGPSFQAGQRVIERVHEEAEVIQLGKDEQLSASQFLEYFLFDRKRQYVPMEKLSGGELRRLHLIMTLIKNPNFLILDEPTNDLDLYTLQVLEDFLHQFQGCLLLVSHDRYLLDKVTDHIFAMEGGGQIRDFYGTYSDYREFEKQLRQHESQKKKSTATKKSANEGRDDNQQARLSYKEKREMQQLEKEIDQLETQKEELTQALNSGETDYQ
jgi:ATP-binding cassette subfamily F protein uup